MELMYPFSHVTTVLCLTSRLYLCVYGLGKRPLATIFCKKYAGLMFIYHL